MKQQITGLCTLLLFACFLFIYLFIHNLHESKFQWAEEDDLSWCLEVIL